MSDATRGRDSPYFVHSLQEYVLAPLTTAARLVERERREVEAERDAFDAFRERLAGIDPEPATPPDRPTRLASGTSTTKTERVRAAYRETVLDTPHFEDAYGESLVEHLANEFGDAIADGVRDSSSVTLTAPYKQALAARTARAVREREDFLDTLAGEANSVENARADLSDAFDALDSTIVPEYHRESFAEQLDAVAARRQRTIQGRESVPHFDEHSLCTYLYDDEPWTYPVLTAVARTREAVSFDDSPNPGSTNSARG